MKACFERVVATLRFQKRSERFLEIPHRSKENSRDWRAGGRTFATAGQFRRVGARARAHPESDLGPIHSMWITSALAEAGPAHSSANYRPSVSVNDCKSRLAKSRQTGAVGKLQRGPHANPETLPRVRWDFNVTPLAIGNG